MTKVSIEMISANSVTLEQVMSAKHIIDISMIDINDGDNIEDFTRWGDGSIIIDTHGKCAIVSVKSNNLNIVELSLTGFQKRGKDYPIIEIKAMDTITTEHDCYVIERSTGSIKFYCVTVM